MGWNWIGFNLIWGHKWHSPSPLWTTIIIWVGNKYLLFLWNRDKALCPLREISTTNSKRKETPTLLSPNYSKGDYAIYFINDETNGAHAVSFQIKNRISIFACVIFEDASVINWGGRAPSQFVYQIYLSSIDTLVTGMFVIAICCRCGWLKSVVESWQVCYLCSNPFTLHLSLLIKVYTSFAFWCLFFSPFYPFR